MAPSRKTDSLRPYDVPFGVTATTVGLLAAIFLPMVTRAPDWPEGLPLLADDSDAVVAAWREERGLPMPPDGEGVLTAWSLLNDDLARRATTRQSLPQRRFATALVTVTRHDARLQHALRARACAPMVERTATRAAGLLTVATRHGLRGATASSAVTDGQRLAWCYVRWERLGLETPEQGAIEALRDTFLRVPRAVQVGFAAWGLGARCGALVGVAGRAVDPEDPRRCARFRSELIPLAKAIDPQYPDALARAHTELLLGEGLRTVLTTSGEGHALDMAAHARAEDESRAAFQRAGEGYERLHQAAPSRRLERFIAAARWGISAD